MGCVKKGKRRGGGCFCEDVDLLDARWNVTTARASRLGLQGGVRRFSAGRDGGCHGTVRVWGVEAYHCFVVFGTLLSLF